jgi:hypothetical protein
MSLTERPKSMKNSYKFIHRPGKYKIEDNKSNRYIQQFNEYRPPHPHTFLQSMAPFNYYGNNGKFLINFNGGPITSTNPKAKKAHLFCDFRNNKSMSLKYRRPCGCPANYNSAKYTPIYPYGECDESIKANKTTYKLKNKSYSKSQKNKNKFFIESRNDNAKNELIENNKSQKVEIKEGIKSEFFDNKYDFRRYINFMQNLKKMRLFHKNQIFNNYKPFLVDDYNLVFVNKYL